MENLSPQQSLDIITSMINQTKGNIQKSSFFFILWGWTIVVANLGVFALMRFTDFENPYLFYAVTIPAAIISVIYGNRQDKNSIVITHLDIVYKWLWMGLGISCFVLFIFGSKINWQLNPVIITMCAAPTLTSGIISRFKPLVWGGVCLWIGGIALFLVTNEYQFVIAAAAIFLGYLVPGYALRTQKN